MFSQLSPFSFWISEGLTLGWILTQTNSDFFMATPSEDDFWTNFYEEGEGRPRNGYEWCDH